MGTANEPPKMREVCNDALISARPHDDARVDDCVVTAVAAFAVVFGANVLVGCVVIRGVDVTVGGTAASTYGQSSVTHPKNRG